MIRLFTPLLATLCLTLATAVAEPYAVGSKVESFTTKDQHDEKFVLEPTKITYLMFSHDMSTGKQANIALSAKGKDFLGNHKAVFVANIHGMPGIGRMFAMPKMRKYAHRIVLADSETLAQHFPSQADKVTILKLNKGKVSEISYWAPNEGKIEDILK